MRAMARSKPTADSTFARVAMDLKHEAFPQLAAAIHASNDRILKRWREVSLKAMPHLDALTLAEFEDTVTEILAAAADALQSADPQQLRGVVESGPQHGIDRFVQKQSVLDLFEELRILRSTVVLEVTEEMERSLDVGESASFHAIFDIIIQQSAMALVQARAQALLEAQATTAEMNERLLISSVRQHELAEEAKRAEAAARESAEQLRILKESLEVEVQRRTVDLMQSNERLQGFTYSVAHDLRQQIRGISTNAAMLMADLGSRLEGDDRRTVERLEESSKRLARLVDDLLTYARLGKQEPNKIPVDLTELAEEVVASLIERGCCRQGTQFRIGQGLASVADSLLVRVVLESLLENACKFSAGTENPIVEFGRQGGSFFVRDNGIGFDMQYIHKLFQPFERLHSDTTYAGTGIGLANVKRIVERHGGKVWAEGKLGEGATFYFTLS